MKKAIISDVHSNWEALQAVLQDAASQGAAEVYCLGDMVGYGPNPRECLDLLIQLDFKLMLLGNHDQAVLTKPDGFNPTAQKSLLWTQKQLAGAGEPAARVQRRRIFLSGLQPKHQEGDFLFVHGSPRDPLNEYVFPEHAYDPRKMEVLFWLVPQACFMGHTHVPGIFTANRQFRCPEELNDRYQLGNGKIMCNVGSVGQPRDGDKRACYVIVEDGVIHFRRIEYDRETTLKKIRAVPELDDTYWCT